MLWQTLSEPLKTRSVQFFRGSGERVVISERTRLTFCLGPLHQPGAPLGTVWERITELSLCQDWGPAGGELPSRHPT